jgi:cytochrome c556
MTKPRKSHLLHFALAGLFVAVAGSATAQVKKGKTRPASTSALMKGLVKPHCDAVKKGVDAAAISDEGWQTLAVDAALLSEASYVLMDDGRCPDKVWADAASKTLREGTAALLKAIDAKDQPAAKKAFGDLTKSCKGCHETHKGKK